MHATDVPSAEVRADPVATPSAGWWARPGTWALVAIGMLAALGFTMGPAYFRHAQGEPPVAGGEAPLRTVRVTRPARAESAVLTLPANIDAFQTTLLYARVNGYLLRWHVDIGDQVKKGQALAEIDTPEADQELKQVRANLIQGRADLDTAVAQLAEAQAALKQADADIAKTQANLEFARSVHRRNEQLTVQHVIAAQDLDESRRDQDARKAELDSAEAQRKTRQSSVATASARIKSHEATVNSLEANVRRLEELQEFKTIRAPFDGIVTRRRAEIGILVNAGSATTAQELFAIAQDDTLRIRVCVPQTHAPGIQVGQPAQVLVPEYPNRVFTARVARTARSIDPASRTLMVELELPNPDRAILPGTFAQVMLTARRADASWTVPGGVLVTRVDGLKVAVVGPDNMVSLRKITLGRDYGASVEVVSGLEGGEALVVNPPDSLADQEKVIVREPAESAVGGRPVAVREEPKTRS